MKTTYRLVAPSAPTVFGPTARTPELAMLGLQSIDRDWPLALEQTDWVEKFDKWVVNRTIILEAEKRAGEWTAETFQPARSPFDLGMSDGVQKQVL